MAKPSLKASTNGIQVAKQALVSADLMQKDLILRVGCSRQPITNFFKGKPVAQPLFIKICEHLDLDWQDIAGLSMSSHPIVASNPTQSNPDNRTDLDILIQDLRQKVYSSIREQCGTMRVLDMSHPIEVNDIYTNVNILEQITGRKHRRIEQLLQECDADDFHRFGLGKITEERISGLAAVQTYQKLIILGKPGAGKTTFLKYLAIQCNAGNFETERVPIFVTLKDFAEAEGKPSLLEYISQKVANQALPRTSPIVHDQWISDFSTLFHYGKALILLDGLDEIRAEDHDRVIKEIRDFSQQFWHNHFVMTCRIAAWEYTFEKFTEVEIADFDQNQVEAFINKWFNGKPISGSRLIEYLAENSRVQQLAVSPLLLTLVCLAFEESGDCPSTRSELYKEGIDALLKKWDAKRGIHRDQAYKKLSPQRKEDLLSQLALITFQHKDYFFRQSFVEQFIADYIRKLPKTSSEPEYLQLDSEAILHSIEAQHGLLVERAKGIYSFSHLTFHEYFVAQEIVFHSNGLNTALAQLMQHVTDRRWREVFLLMAEMLRDASILLLSIKQRADQLLAGSDKFQSFLAQVCELAAAPELSGIKTAAVRAFYFDIDFDIDENRSVALQLDQRANQLVCASFLTRMLPGVTLKDALSIAQNYDNKISEPTKKITAAKSANTVMLFAIKIALNSGELAMKERELLRTLLQRLNGKFPNDETTREIADKAREVAKTRHHIGQEGYFNLQEKEKLRQYYYIIQLLVECLNSDGCMLAPERHQEIMDTLFFPCSVVVI